MGALLAGAGCGAPPDGGPAELVVRGGAIHTSDAQQPVAQALAVRSTWLGGVRTFLAGSHD